MWPSQQQKFISTPAYKPRFSSFVDRHFQMRYTRRMLFLVILSSLVYGIPLFYLVNENYNFLLELAYKLTPNLAKHIEGEQIAFNVGISGIMLSQWVLVWLFGRRMTEQIVVPLKKLRNHLRLLSRGELSVPEVRVRQKDEFQDLISAYNYYYSAMREDVRRDLIKLLSLQKNISDHKSSILINEMIKERAIQLNLDINASNASEPEKPRDHSAAS